MIKPRSFPANRQAADYKNKNRFSRLNGNNARAGKSDGVSNIGGRLNYAKHLANISALIFLTCIFFCFLPFVGPLDLLIMRCNDAHFIGLNELKFISFKITNGALNVALVTKPVVIKLFNEKFALRHLQLRAHKN